MTVPAETAERADQPGGSVFAGAVICEVIRLPVRLGCHSPVFEQNVWDLTVVDGIPRFFSPSRRIWISPRSATRGGGRSRRSTCWR
ncbi:hypothetical protein ACFWAN_23410 [Streptomyces mirabilis]|uniref:hypothetical protein n=1 Tax=Streptomyces mirabilis TaxID=68239 RepID=UPI00364AE093